MESTDRDLRESWEQRLSKDLSDLRTDLKDLQAWRAVHMNQCHPALLQTDAKMEGRWAIVAGFCFGIGVALGYAAAELIRRWFGG